MIEINKIYNNDCMNILPNIDDNSIQLTITDIPYDEASRASNGLRLLEREKADVLTFNLNDWMEQVYRVTKGTVIVFCGIGQVSPIYNFFRDKDNGTVRQLLWVKTNPSPMNGDSVYLSGVENAVWYRKPNSTFNAHCKNTVFEYASGTSKLHPTEKNHKLIAELIRDNSNEGDLILDPCCGSGSHCLVAKENNRNFIGIELYKDYYEIATKRLKQPIQKKLLGFG